MFHISLYPVFDSYLLVVVVALLLAGLMWFGPSREKTGRGQRAIIGLLRAAAILLVLLAMLRPTLIYTQTKKQPATLIVLADQSRSMSVPDVVNNKTRWDALRGTLADAGSALAKLQRDFELKAYVFDSDLHEARAEGGRIELADKPEGQQTAIGPALEEVLRREAGKRLLGVVLLSDGSQRAYASRDLPPQTAATRLKHVGCRLFTIPFGLSRGLGEAQDVALRDLVVSPSTVFVKNELSVRGEVRIDGYVNVGIPVRVLFETAPDKMEVVAEQVVKADVDGQLLPVALGYIPQAPGEHKLTLEAVKQPGELVTTNNELSTFVNVLKGGLNVLYIEGGLRPETGRIRRALASSPEIKVDFKRLPTELAGCFKPGKYDVYVIGDVDSTAFHGNELADLANCVSRGAGLIMIGGLQTFGPGGYSTTPLAKLLPVGMDWLERQRPDEAVRSDVQWPGPLKMQPTAVGMMHFALILAASREQNAALWAKLPALDGANKFHDLAPGAVVLADAGKDKPLLVAHSFDNGRVMAFAGDSTWRWPMHGFESAHDRFWRQIILWLAKKDEMQDGSVRIRLTQRRFAPSQKVEFSVVATAPGGGPIADADFKAEIVLPNGLRRPLPLVRQNEQMNGSFADTQMPGDYAIEVTASQKDQPLGAARARFLVFQQDLELDNASADAGTMESLATMTGGRSLAPEELPELIRSLTEDPEKLEVKQETKQTFWDTWPFFVTFVALLSVEWYLRKRWGLV
jgi:uncharacterized membrane protein